MASPRVPAAHQLRQPRYSLTAVTLVQNEARWLPEWLEYHLLPAIAVDHFYVYDDDASGAGSTDGLVATLAPYRGLVTLHRVSELGPLPKRGDIRFSDESLSVSDMRMCSQRPPYLSYRRVGSTCSRNRLQFPQQPVAIRHAAAAYGHHSRAMLLIDVDEFIIHTPASQVPSRLLRYARLHASKSAASVLMSAIRGGVGAVKLHSVVMLPDEQFYTGGPDDGLFLTRNCTRQLVAATTRAGAVKRGEVSRGKNVVVPHALGLLDGLHYFGSIHRIALRGRATKKVSGERLGLHLAHFRYRSASAWAARRNHTYLRSGLRDGRAAARRYGAKSWESGKSLGSFATPEKAAVAMKADQVAKWEAVLHEALHKPWTHSVPQLGLLRHWAALATAMTNRWQKHSDLRAGAPPPPAVRRLIDAAAAMVSRLSVLLVAEPRSGSTLVGKLSFDARKDFLYVYEPCRLRPKGAAWKRYDGTFFDTECSSWVAEILQCGLSLSGFRMLQRDAGAFNAQSSALAAITDARRVTKGSRSIDDAGAYMDWLHRCWSSHRAAKVVRIRDPAALRAERQVDDARFRVVHLIRDPNKVVASRLSLHAFTRRGHFNPEGGAEGVVRATCRAMNAMVRMPLLPSALRRYDYEEVLSAPTAFLSDLYAWLGLESDLPPSVLRMVRQCRLGNNTAPFFASSNRFRVCEFDDKPGHNSAPRRRVQLTQQHGELVARYCGSLATLHQRSAAHVSAIANRLKP